MGGPAGVLRKPTSGPAAGSTRCTSAPMSDTDHTPPSATKYVGAVAGSPISTGYTSTSSAGDVAARASA